MRNVEAEALRIVEAALDREGDERDAFVAGECDGSPELEARVRAILAMESASTDALSTRVMATRHPGGEAVPERVGKFRVTGKIGEGGMGMVVRAERDDGVYSQSVAIKLIRSDLRDARDRERFANERRLLARLSHRSIARILDGGEQDGRPYLVMELVEGRPVTDDLDARGAGLAETLSVFEEIAEAVSHAHRNLVIHGDLKPANIFRTADGGVKLLDFGIGRLAGDLDHGGEGYPLTPAFSAPERVAGEPPGVASDVYSLGVLLHLMLAGRLPDGEGAAMSRVATGGRIPPDRLRGDLDAIVARACAAAPGERYPDAAAMAADVRRFRERRPVRARPHTFRYVAGRFLRRNRVTVAAAAALFLVLAAAAIVSLTLFFDARRQRAAAEARFEEVRSLAKYQLFTLYDQLAGVPGTLRARLRLSTEAQAYLDRLASLPNAPADVRLETAAGYNRLAEIQGVPSRPNLGLVEEARRNLARAAAMLAPLAADGSGRAAARHLAWTRLMQADVAIWQDNEADRGARLLAAAEPLVARARDASPEWTALESFRRGVRADMLGWSERYSEEAAFATDTLAWLDRLPDAVKRSTPYVIARAEALNAHAEGVWYTGARERALPDARAADALIRAELARHPDRPDLLSARVASGYNLITTLEPLGLREGLLDMAQQVVTIGRRVRALEPNDRFIAWRVRNAEALYAQFLALAGRHQEAIDTQAAVVAADERKLARAPADIRALRDLSFSRKVLGSLMWDSGRRADGCRLWRESDLGFARLERSGNLNEWDRSNVVAGLRQDLRRCAG